MRSGRRVGALVGAVLVLSSGCASDRVDLEPAMVEVLEVWYGPSDTGGAVAAIGLADGSVHTAAIGDAAPG